MTLSTPGGVSPPPFQHPAGLCVDVPELLFRVQDAEGRGPYRPGFSARWRDKTNPRHPPAWWNELGMGFFEAHNLVDPALHSGCAFRSIAQLKDWFSPSELRRLDALGFRLVTIRPEAVFAETPTQVVFGVAAPLHTCRSVIKLGSKAMEALA